MKSAGLRLRGFKSLSAHQKAVAFRCFGARDVVSSRLFMSHEDVHNTDKMVGPLPRAAADELVRERMDPAAYGGFLSAQTDMTDDDRAKAIVWYYGRVCIFYILFLWLHWLHRDFPVWRASLVLAPFLL